MADVNINIVSCSTSIITKSGGIKAIITGVCIRDKNITYEISHFINGSHQSDWLYRFEFEIDDVVKQKAGFEYNNKPVIIL